MLSVLGGNEEAMTAQEIRSQRPHGVSRETCSFAHPETFYLQEIAAQLAELVDALTTVANEISNAAQKVSQP